jgi:hypothetical protein
MTSAGETLVRLLAKTAVGDKNQGNDKVEGKILQVAATPRICESTFRYIDEDRGSATRRGLVGISASMSEDTSGNICTSLDTWQYIWMYEKKSTSHWA